MSIPKGALKSIEGVCLDIDETLSTRGKLTAEAFSALWALKNAGLKVVPITGRPAGWCDHIARFWPVDAVVGENGAFTFYMETGPAGISLRKRLDTPLGRLTITEARARLDALGKAVRARFPRAQWASDQAYREFDLAIDICEDVPAWPDAEVTELLALCHAAGAHAKLSSVHVNAWFGEYDKRAGLEHWLKSGCPGLVKGTAPANFRNWLFIGDSPNDEPMFAFFENSVGVANLSKYLDTLRTPPRWMTSAESGAGFAEMAGRLIDDRK